MHAGVRRAGRRARRPTPRAARPRATASRRPAPASVNTDRWWSGSACTSSSDAPHAAASASSTATVASFGHVGHALEHRCRVRPGARSTPVECRRCASGSRCRSTTTRSRASRRCAGDTMRRVRGGRRARRVRLALAVGPPLPRRREVRRPARPRGVLRADRRRSPRSRASSPRPRLGTLVLCEALRPASVLAKSLATLDRICGGRLDVGHRRRLVRARVRGDRHGRCRRRGSGWRASARRSTVCRGLLGGGPFTFDGALPPRSRRVNEPPAVQRPDAADLRRRQGRPAPRRSSPSSPTAGTPAGSGRPTPTASGSTCSSAACERDRPRPRDGAAIARPLRAVRRGRSRPRPALRAPAGDERRPACSTASTLDEWRVGRLVGTVEQVREQAAGWAGARRRDPGRRRRVRCRSRSPPSTTSNCSPSALRRAAVTPERR